MSSNFDFLPEEKSWCKDVRRAERRIYSDPASACTKARRALEFVVGEVYERELNADKQGDLFADVDARPFKRWVQNQDPDLYDAFHQIRLSGNQGAHHQKNGDVEPEEALITIRSLKQVVWWYVQRYAPAHAAKGEASFQPPAPEKRRSADAEEPQAQGRTAEEPDRPPSGARSDGATTAAGAREKRVRALEHSSTPQLAQLIKEESPTSTAVEIATAILLNRIRDANDELLTTFR